MTQWQNFSHKIVKVKKMISIVTLRFLADIIISFMAFPFKVIVVSQRSATSSDSKAKKEKKLSETRVSKSALNVWLRRLYMKFLYFSYWNLWIEQRMRTERFMTKTTKYKQRSYSRISNKMKLWVLSWVLLVAFSDPVFCDMFWRQANELLAQEVT